MNNQELLKKLYKIFFSTASNSTLPNRDEIKKTNEAFYSFMEKVKNNPKILGEDDAELNTYLSDYMDEYAFAAFCIGIAIGKNIETEIEFINHHLESIE